MDEDQPDEIIDLELVPRNIVAPIRVIRDYSEDLVDEITDYFISGMSLQDISEIQGMPSTAVMYRWMKQRKEFLDKMTEAREIRALALEDRIAASIDPNAHKDSVPAKRLAFDQAAWLAEKADPKKFGRKVEVGGSGQPLIIQVVTGVPHREEKVIKDVVESAVKDIVSIEELRAPPEPDDAA